MNAQHTPEPWIVDDMADLEVMKDGIDKGDWIAVEAPESGGHVAYCHPMNAPLIAAAPDLLNAVEHVLVMSEDGGDMMDISFNFLRDAIKKATGQ